MVAMADFGWVCMLKLVVEFGLLYLVILINYMILVLSLLRQCIEFLGMYWIQGFGLIFGVGIFL